MHEKEVKNQAEHEELPVDTNEEANSGNKEENLQSQEENFEAEGNEPDTDRDTTQERSPVAGARAYRAVR